MSDDRPPPATGQWQFFQAPDLRWCWRRFLTDGDAAETSRTFDDFGMCVRDAIGNGFHSKRQRYSARNRDWTTAYRLDAIPVSRVVPHRNSKPGTTAKASPT